MSRFQVLGCVRCRRKKQTNTWPNILKVKLSTKNLQTPLSRRAAEIIVKGFFCSCCGFQLGFFASSGASFEQKQALISFLKFLFIDILCWFFVSFNPAVCPASQFNQFPMRLSFLNIKFSKKYICERVYYVLELIPIVLLRWIKIRFACIFTFVLAVSLAIQITFTAVFAFQHFCLWFFVKNKLFVRFLLTSFLDIHTTVFVYVVTFIIQPTNKRSLGIISLLCV